MMDAQLSTLHLHPFWQFSPQVNQLCQPLFQQFNITYFDYSRFYPDNRCATLSSDPNYISYLLKDSRYRCAAGRIGPGKHLWQTYVDPLLIEQTSQRFDYYHGLTYARQQPNYFELINFSAPRHQAKVLEIFLNYQEVLDYFIQIFIKNIEPFLQKHKKSRLLLPNNFIEKNTIREEMTVSVQQFIQQINSSSQLRKNTLLFKLNQEMVNLSVREVQCLVLLSKGACTKQMAKTLNVSVRTIDVYMTNLLKKSSSSNRIELLARLEGNTINLLQTLMVKF